MAAINACDDVVGTLKIKFGIELAVNPTPTVAGIPAGASANVNDSLVNTPNNCCDNHNKTTV